VHSHHSKLFGRRKSSYQDNKVDPAGGASGVLYSFLSKDSGGLRGVEVVILEGCITVTKFLSVCAR
jgi:hypothetical protein